MIKAEDVQYNTMKSRIESWRGVYADWQIIDSSTWLKMIEPFEPKQVKEVNGQRVISYGLSSFGYDMRVANEFKIFSASTGQLTVIDPKAIEEKALVDYVGGYCIIPPNSFALARSVEYFRMPANVTGIVLGKSTYARCFSEDTEVALVDGTSISLHNLVKCYEQGQKKYGYGLNSDGNVVVQEIAAPRFIGRDALIEVTLDNGKKIRCTPDHEFITRRGVYEQAHELRPGDSLMPLYRYVQRGYEMVHHPGSGQLEATYRLSDAWNINHGKYEATDNDHRHHIDHNKHNNNPWNITRMRAADHTRMHNSEFYSYGYDVEQHSAKISEAIQQLWNSGSDEWRQAFSESQSRKASDFWNKEEYSDRREALIQHRISSWTDKKRAAVAERMTERMSDDGVRQMIGEKSKEAWTRDNGERRKMQAEIMRENMTKHSITNEALTDALRKAGSIRGAARMLGCDRSVFRRFPEVLSKFKTNHKVLSVKELKGAHDVYCLTMPDTGNFALSAGVFVSNCGIVTNFTPLESGWEGFVTIEISNTTPVPVKVYANEGVAQCLFFGGEFPLVTYADRKGKYQAQTGITLAKV